MPKYNMPDEPKKLEIKYLDMNLNSVLYEYAKHVGLNGFPGTGYYEIFVDTKKDKVIYKWMVEKE